MEARLEPFASTKRLFELGDVFPTEPITEETVFQTHLRVVEYIDDDHVLLGFIDTLAILRRGQSMKDAIVVEHGSPLFPPRQSEGQYWQVAHFGLEPGDGPRRRGHAIMPLIDEAAGFLGSALVRFTVTSTSISRLELRAFVRLEAEGTEDNLRRIVTGADGSFAAVGRNLIAAGGASGPVLVSVKPELNGTSIAFFPSDRGDVIIQGRNGEWWTGDPADPDRLVRERSSNNFVDTGGTIRILETDEGSVPVSGTETGDLWFRRSGPEWVRHDWWLPEVNRDCASPELRCGRLVARPFFDIADQGPIGEGVVHTFERCDAVFYTIPGRDQCSSSLKIEWSEHRLPSDRDAVFPISARGQRAVFGGNGGLLLELTMD